VEGSIQGASNLIRIREEKEGPFRVNHPSPSGEGPGVRCSEVRNPSSEK
jgi:hypothetical protein